MATITAHSAAVSRDLALLLVGALAGLGATRIVKTGIAALLRPGSAPSGCPRHVMTSGRAAAARDPH